MKKLLVLSLLSFVVFQSSIAQEKGAFKSIRIGLSVSPDYNFRNLQAPDNLQNIADSRDDAELAKLGYTVGLRFVFALRKHFAIETGILYADRGYRSNLSLNDNLGNIIGSVDLKHHINYLEIPLKMNVALLAKKRIHFFLSAGLSGNIFLFENIDYAFDYFSGQSEESSARSNQNNLNRLSLTALGGLGIDLFLTKRFSVRAEPIFRYAIISNTDSSIKQYPYSFGANLGLFLKL